MGIYIPDGGMSQDCKVVIGVEGDYWLVMKGF